MHTITLTVQTVGLTEGDLNTLADDLMAAAMAVTNAAEYEGEDAMTGDLDVVIDPPAGTWVATSAPDAYDYGYTKQVSQTVEFRGTQLRVVVVPTTYVEYQVGRYQSGLYVAFKGDTYDAVCATAQAF